MPSAGGRLGVGVGRPGGAGDEARGIAPRRDPSNAAFDAHHAAAFGGPGGVILVDGVVVRTQSDQIFLVGGPAGGPGGEVVDLGVVGRRIAARPRTHGVLGRGKHALLPRGHALGAIQVYRAVLGVNEADVAALGESAGNELCAGHAGAVGELEGDIGGVGRRGDDAVELVQREDDVGVHGRQCAGVALEEDLLGGGEGIIFVDGGEHPLDIGDIGGIGRNGDGVWAVGAAGIAHSGFGAAGRIELLEQLLGHGGYEARLGAAEF